MGNYTGPSPARSFAPVSTKDRFNGDGSSVNFDLTYDVAPGGFNSLSVYVEDVWQEPTTAFTVGNDGSGNPRRITFTTAPPSGTNNIVVIQRDRETARVIPDDGTITNAKLDTTMITGQTEVTAVGADHVLIYDANQTALKKALVSTLGNVISNGANNRILTDTGTVGSINAESTLTYDGSTLALTGSQTVSGTVTAGGFTIGSAVISEAELEILDGATVSTAELNSLASIGSDTVATQLATKAPLASPALTGTATAVNLTLSGNLTVNGTTTTVSTTNTVISDNLLELNNGAGSNANDCGIVIERGSTGDNAFMGFDENGANSSFVFGTTTATGASTGSLTITPIPIKIGGLIIGSADINEAELEILDGATLTTTELNYVDGVTGAIQGQIDSKLATAGGTMTGGLDFGDDIKARFGTGNDFEIYFDDTNTKLKHTPGTGTLMIEGDSVAINKGDSSETLAQFNANGAVSLYFDNSAKLATNSGGVAITGTITATTFSGSGASLTNLPAANISGNVPAPTADTDIGAIREVAIYASSSTTPTTLTIATGTSITPATWAEGNGHLTSTAYSVVGNSYGGAATFRGFNQNGGQALQGKTRSTLAGTWRIITPPVYASGTTGGQNSYNWATSMAGLMQRIS